MQGGATNPFLVMLVFCFGGRVRSTEWDSRSLACPADLGFKQSWLNRSGLWPDAQFISRTISSYPEKRGSSPTYSRWDTTCPCCTSISLKVRGGCRWSFPPDLAHEKWLPFHRESQAVLRWRLSLCRHFSLAHSSSIQISAQMLALVQGTEAYEEQKAGEKRWKGFHYQG